LVTLDAGQDLEADLLVILDVADLERTGMRLDRPSLRDVPTVNIDHHVTNTAFAAINIVDPSAVATSEIIFDVISELGVDIDHDIAVCLLTGIVTDTQGFRVAATTPRTMRIAAELMEHGAPLGEICDEVFKTKPASSLKLWGLALGGVQQRGPIVFAELRPWMLAEAGVGMEESEGLVNLLASVRDAQVTVLFKEVAEEGVRISVRTSSKVNAAGICEYFGGGGHARAAGCSIPLPLAEAEAVFLAHVEEVLREV
jgi:phosphoesterase RecJ-like protein